MSDLLPASARESMHNNVRDESAFQLRSISAANELKISVLANGCIYAIECKGILINQLLASPLAGGIQRIYLRVHRDTGIQFIEWLERVQPTTLLRPRIDSYGAEHGRV